MAKVCLWSKLAWQNSRMVAVRENSSRIGQRCFNSPNRHEQLSKSIVNECQKCLQVRSSEQDHV